MKPKTAASWRDCLRKWLNPNLGDLPLSAVDNLSVRELVSKMAAAGLAPKSIHNYVQMVKMVAASALNDRGEEVYVRKWNHEFIDLPEIKNQRTPSLISEEVEVVVAASEGTVECSTPSLRARVCG